MKKIYKDWIYFVLILLFSLLGMKALFHPGLFTAHDIWHQVARLYHYNQAVNDGQFPPYWISSLAKGYGYPLFFFSYHLPWIISLPFLKVGFDIPTTLKIVFFISYLFSGIFMYLFSNSVLKNRLASTLASILYLWSPYHFLTIFVSASLGIVLVFTFLPLLLLGIHKSKDGTNIGIPIFALGLSGIILSHIMHVVFLLPLIFVFFIWELLSGQDKMIFIKRVSFGFILGLLLSSFYLIPAQFYNQYTKVNQETGFVDLYKRNFINFKQLMYSKWGYGPIVKNAKDQEISFQLGIAQWISILGIIILLLFRKLPNRTYKRLSFYLLLGFIFSTFLMLDYSLPVWQLVKRVVTIDYPFRELLPLSFIGSFFAAILFISIKKRLQIAVFVLLILITLYTNRNHVNVNLYTNIPLSLYIDSEITTNSFNEYLPLNANSRFLSKSNTFIEGGNLSASNIKYTPNSLAFDLNAWSEVSASVGQFYFPGQTLYLDEKVKKFDIDKDGRISFLAPSGLHHIKVKYEETFIIKLAKLLSVLGMLFLISQLFKKKVYF